MPRRKRRKNSDKIGMASADSETRQRVAKAGGDAHHEKRGLENVKAERRKEISVMGGRARWSAFNREKFAHAKEELSQEKPTLP